MQTLSFLILLVILCFAAGIYPIWRANLPIYGVIISAFAIILYFLIFHKVEIVEHLQISGEAVQNVGGIFNSEQMKVKNLEVSGTLTTFGALNAQGDIAANRSFNLLPRGVIVAWNGTSAPAGWALCNGQNGTPNLQDRFILGMGANQINSAGGAHQITLQVGHLPPHNHGFGVGGGGGHRGNMGTTEGWGCNFGQNCAYNNVTSNTGNGSPFSIMPPYYTLAYIMKL